jgi:hypothetical protein
MDDFFLILNWSEFYIRKKKKSKSTIKNKNKQIKIKSISKANKKFYKITTGPFFENGKMKYHKQKTFQNKLNKNKNGSFKGNFWIYNVDTYTYNFSLNITSIIRTTIIINNKQ